MSKFIVKALKPRNPLVAACHQRQAGGLLHLHVRRALDVCRHVPRLACHQRQAGAHRRPRAGVRQMAERALQGELRALHRERHSP